MADITLDNLVKKFGRQTAVDHLNLAIKDKEFVAILGPSGCGKTTTMNMISGLLKPDSGQVLFDGKVMNKVPPGKRGVGFVFQNYAIFTYMTVYDNIAFGLKVNKVPPGTIDKEVKGVAELLQVDHLLEMNAGKLSVNDMQKVALGRSMVTKPQIFLMDEPLSNLDAALRSKMRAELKKIQQELGQTTIYVTHDQVEAMSLANKIAVMNFAVLQQYDTPHNIYNHPVNMFVANFIGSPTINFVEATFQTDKLILNDFQGSHFPLSSSAANQIQTKLKNDEVVIGIRPENIKVTNWEAGGNSNFKAKIVDYEPLGARTVLYMHLGTNTDSIIKSTMPSDFIAKNGSTVSLTFEEQHLYVFDKESTELVWRYAS
jgi:multiple sugar transport system ATP-binding protein